MVLVQRAPAAGAPARRQEGPSACKGLLAQAARCCCLSLLSGWAPLVRQACSLLLLLLALSRTELTQSSSRGSAATPSFVSVRGGSSPPYHEPSRGPDPGWHWQEMHLPSGPVHLCSVDVHDSLTGCYHTKLPAGLHPGLSRSGAPCGAVLTAPHCVGTGMGFSCSCCQSGDVVV